MDDNYSDVMDLGITGMVFYPNKVGEGWRRSEGEVWKKEIDTNLDVIDDDIAFLKKHGIHYVYFPPSAAAITKFGLISIWPQNEEQISTVNKRWKL